MKSENAIITIESDHVILLKRSYIQIYNEFIS